MGYKTVQKPLKVPEGDYCWRYTADNDGSYTICEHFDNEGGHPHCTEGFFMPYVYGAKQDPKGVRKSEECKCLQTKEELKS